MESLKKQQKPWKSMVVLGILWVTMFYEWSWIWGLIFKLWSFRSIKTGETYLVEDIKVAENPIVFWAIVLTWLFVSIFVIWYDFRHLI